ncbi:H-type lectin domain protein (macronuclear) [Tetrahymena thermophila SB210]|uniref:H-type lectin domain protein n=1 Tax=Tetrahymena thermophila (strain SB210) TaxID=312017 RepID=Q234X9_TETTS|nr:H-type lectin domain protein [Tetrahymena thermophila SB210]EAR91874.2 H-type lectin domain protein [Tetrahymena thermophila SB210]|eukprot:XP_001012119.2 H-type lectin domain protein [Tetrahymena thermophila SB210]
MADGYMEYTINHKKQYTQIPQVFIGISTLDYLTQTNYISYQFTVQEVNIDKTIIRIYKFDQSIAITTNKFNLDHGNQYLMKFQLPMDQNKQRNSKCTLLGFNSTNSNNALREIGVSISAASDSDYYIIQVITSETNYIQEILVNCIEFYTDSQNEQYSMIANLDESDFKDITSSNKINWIQHINNNFQNNQPEIFVGIKGMTNNHQETIAMKKNAFLNVQKNIIWLYSKTQMYAGNASKVAQFVMVMISAKFVNQDIF